MAAMYDNISTENIDHRIANVCASLASYHHDYALLAARIEISRLHKISPARTFRDSITILRVAGILSSISFTYSDDEWNLIEANIAHENDLRLDYFEFGALKLLSVGGRCIELPQYMYMRVALAINMYEKTLDPAFETYRLLARGIYKHTDITMQHAGTTIGQLSSSALMPLRGSDIDGIYDTLRDAAKFADIGASVGMSISNTPTTGSGIFPIIKLFDRMCGLSVERGRDTAAYPMAVYLEPWHSDLFAFLNASTCHIRIALWMPDLFMKRVKEGGKWSLFCPSTAPGLDGVYGSDFVALYETYENRKLATAVISAQNIWRMILDTQIKTGMPHILFKDTANIKSNQRHLGTIKCASLCSGIVQYSSDTEIAICATASIAVDRLVIGENGGGGGGGGGAAESSQLTFDFIGFAKAIATVVFNLNRIINTTKYPTNMAVRLNIINRPIGVGIHGLAELFMKLHLPFESREARLLNHQIFEQLYYSALDASCKISEGYGSPCPGFIGSPTAIGVLQFDMWNVKPMLNLDYTILRKRIRRFGLANTLLVTADGEALEPILSNVYVRGTCEIINHHLIDDLQKIGMWNDKIREKIIRANGSIQRILEIPEIIRRIYKTVWEVSSKNLIDMAVDRAAFIDHSQSLNLYVAKSTHSVITSLQFYAWKAGLKSGCYYLRVRQPSQQPSSSSSSVSSSSSSLLLATAIAADINAPIQSAPLVPPQSQEEEDNNTTEVPSSSSSSSPMPSKLVKL